MWEVWGFSWVWLGLLGLEVVEEGICVGLDLGGCRVG